METEKDTSPKSGTKKQKEAKIKADFQFLPDSPEQIAESIDRTGLRGELNQAVQAAIARVDRSQQNSNHPAINETGEVDSADEAPLK